METLKIDQIVADENQPRKLFAVDKMARLRDSVKRYGIMNPLKVEKVANGKYQLLDGERRFRTAQELKLKEVPVIVSKSLNDNDRLIKQFHIQQQNEDWTNVEKAMAITRLAEDTKMTVKELCEALSMPDRTVQRYLQFGDIVDKELFVRSELNIDWAESINGVNTTARLATQRELKKPYVHSDEKTMEKAIITRIMAGEIKRPAELAKLKDIFRTDPTTIKTFVDSPKTSTIELFNKTGAEGAYAFRASMNAIRGFSINARKFLKSKSVKIEGGHLMELKKASKLLQEFIDLAE